GRGSAAADRHTPDVSAVDVVLVGTEHHSRAIEAHGNRFDFKLARREQGGFPTGRRNRGQVRPAIPFPREYEGTPSAPEQLVRGIDDPERAAFPRARLPDLAAFSVRDSGHPNRPGFGGRFRAEDEERSRRRDAEERDFATVRRP